MLPNLDLLPSLPPHLLFLPVLIIYHYGLLASFFYPHSRTILGLLDG
jgi:hypothetical protein